MLFSCKSSFLETHITQWDSTAVSGLWPSATGEKTTRSVTVLGNTTPIHSFSRDAYTRSLIDKDSALPNRCSRTCIKPRCIWDFTVPSGIPSCKLISTCDRPWPRLSSNARRHCGRNLLNCPCCDLSVETRLSRGTGLRPVRRFSHVYSRVNHQLRLQFRHRSIQRRRAIIAMNETSDPLVASNAAAWRQIHMKISCVASSASE